MRICKTNISLWTTSRKQQIRMLMMRKNLLTTSTATGTVIIQIGTTKEMIVAIMTGIARAIGMIMKGVTVVAGMTTMMFGIITVMLAKAKVVNVMTIGTAEVMIEAAAE